MGKTDFQHGRCGCLLGFWMETILAIFDLQVTRILLTFESTGLLVQEKKCKIDFQGDGFLGFLTGMILAIFDLQPPNTSHQVLSQLAIEFWRISAR